MKPLVVDCETTSFQKGNPYSERNKLCYVGSYGGIQSNLYSVEYSSQPYGGSIAEINRQFFLHDLFVAFNAKFDIAWLRRYGINVGHMDCWDLQLVHFIIHGQDTPFCSLNDACNRVGISGKSDDLADRYWDQGVDTTSIPQSELEEYLEGDLKAEWELFQWQLDYLKDKPLLKRLCWDACQDEICTQEMEWNGLHYDFELSKKLGDEYLERIAEIDKHLETCISQPVGNWNSNDWLSAILYGGVCQMDIPEEFEFVRKDGTVSSRRRHIKYPITFPRIVEPIKGTERQKKPGFYEVNEGVLRRLKATGTARKIIELMLERSKLEKRVGTYFHGIPALYKEMDWCDNKIHGQLNHCVTITGRLSSSHPNQQNLDPLVRKCLQSRFPIF